jgi:NAD+ synthase (glutamine-hydrolysing)
MASMPKLRLALAQVDSVVGDLGANSALIVAWTTRARDSGAELVAFPEMMLTGYPVEDLVFRESFVAASRAALDSLAITLDAAGLGGVAVIVGYLDADGPVAPGAGSRTTGPRNAAALIAGGQVVARYFKHHLPNYGVFDEDRYFVPGKNLPVLRLHRPGQEPVDLAMVICEDLWAAGGPVTIAGEAAAALIVCINGSPFERAKDDLRLELGRRRAAEAGATLAYVNLVGGQDELVFDGDSFVIEPGGRLLARTAQFTHELLVVELELPAAASEFLGIPEPEAAIEPTSAAGPVSTAKPAKPNDPFKPEAATQPGATATAITVTWHDVRLPAPATEPEPITAGSTTTGSATTGPATTGLTTTGSITAEPPERLCDEAEVWGALVTGTRDYVRKNGFRSVALGLSGGIDSAVVATIAADAIGAENVFAVSMPSEYSSEHSRSDAAELATRRGIHFQVNPIEPMVRTFLDHLPLSGLAAENLQARVRGVVLMALSNQDGHLILTTGNKTELAVGYSTLYGDSVGGYNPLKDVPKTLVWKLARWRNAEADKFGEQPPIPENSISKPPSAELRPGQLDSDSLPDYDELDAILADYVDGDLGRAELLAAGHDEATVDRVVRMVDLAEYKRRQSAPGPKIGHKAFGRDRRLPITNRWREHG